MKPPRQPAAAALIALAFALSTPAFALDGADLYAEKTCAGCHGRDAKTPILPIYPKLAGQSPEYSFNQMQDIASGARANGQSAAMKGVMSLVSEEEMRAIAEWLGTLHATASPRVGAGETSGPFGRCVRVSNPCRRDPHGIAVHYP
jgi:cytochrome c